MSDKTPGTLPRDIFSGHYEATLRALGRKLKEAREYLGLTPEFVKTQAYTGVDSLLSYEAGEAEMGLYDLYVLARLYRRPIGWFFDDTEPEVPSNIADACKGLSANDQREVARFAQFISQAGGPPRIGRKGGKL